MVMKCLSMVEWLLRNSTKYGDPEGVLEVHISRGSEELRIKWTERAAGAAGYSDAVDSGFGSKFLDLTINEQLQRNYARTWTEDGVDIEITLSGKLFSEIRSYPSILSTVVNTPDGSDLSERLCMIWPT